MDNNKTPLNKLEEGLDDRLTDGAWRHPTVNHYFRPGILIVIGMIITSIGIAYLWSPQREIGQVLILLGQTINLIGIIRAGIAPLVRQNNEIIKLLREQNSPQDNQPK